MSDEKKAVAVDTLPGDTSGSNSIDITTQVDEAQGYDQKATKALLRKLDWNIIPFMSLIYL